MANWKILNRKEKKSILELIRRQWGCSTDFLEGLSERYAFLLTPKDKIYIVNKAVLDADLSAFRIDRLGLYFGEVFKSEIRLSIEGSQIIGPASSKNVVEISSEEVRRWLNGQELQVDESIWGFQIVVSGNDFLGCGKASGGKLFNYVPKARRISTDA